MHVGICFHLPAVCALKSALSPVGNKSVKCELMGALQQLCFDGSMSAVMSDDAHVKPIITTFHRM